MKWALLVGLTLLAVFCGYVWYIFTYGDELSHKTGWTVLQLIEWDERENPFVVSELRRTDDRILTAVSIRGVGESQSGPTTPPQVMPGKAWVLLNEHAADEKVLIMPKYASYRVSCATVGRLPHAVPDVDDYVLEYLSAICS